MKSLSRSRKLPTRFVAMALAAVFGVSLLGAALAPRPALADGAASTRNIIFGAAAVGATLLILNHNKKVHQKYAEYDRRQAEDEAAKNQAQAAYESERQAYGHEVALVGEYQKEAAYQHAQVVGRDREIASLRHSLVVAKYGSHRADRVAYAPRPQRHHVRRVARTSPHRAAHNSRPPAPRAIAMRDPQPQVVSYGWGAF